MTKYKVKIIEYLQRVVEVEADSVEDAVSMVEDMYYNEEIVLDADDFDHMEMKVFKYKKR